MTSKRLTIVGISLAVVAVLGVGIWLWHRDAGSEAGGGTFRIGFNTWVGYGPLYVAREAGIFKKNGLNVELIRLEGTGERRAALLSKRIEALGSTIDDFVVGLSEGVNGKMVAVLDESRGADGIVAKQGIRTVQDLRGKRIAVQPGFVNHFFLLYVLDKAGIGPTEFQLVPLEPDKAADALLAGEVDVAVTWEPHLSAIKDTKGFELVLTTADPSAQHIIFDNLVIRTDVLDDRTKDVIALLKSWYEAIDYIKGNPEASYGILSKAFDITSEKEVGEMMEGVYFPTPQQNLDFMAQASGAQSIAKKVVDLYLKVDVIRTAPSVTSIKSSIDPQFLRAAVSK
ncbi:MAG: ABC transporter substrate-binding protein [Xanthobacteraceae bacterium]